jgi:hypothetical protein
MQHAVFEIVKSAVAKNKADRGSVRDARVPETFLLVLDGDGTYEPKRAFHAGRPK